jgi:hypothetical protein
MTQNGPNANGAEMLHVNASLSNGAQGTLTIMMQGQQVAGGDDGGTRLSITSTQVTISQDGSTPLYQGYLTRLRNDDSSWRITALLAKPGASSAQLELQIRLAVDNSGNLTGVIQGAPAQGQTPSSQPALPPGQQE